MALDTRKYEHKHKNLIRDIRPMYVRVGDWLTRPTNSLIVFMFGAGSVYYFDMARNLADVILLLYLFFFLFLYFHEKKLAFKLPMGSKFRDKNNEGPGRSGKAEGILFLGNIKNTKEEIWFTNSDARTHILYLGTTGSGKTEGLKSIATNALAWGSGFVYVDGKADTDLWSSLSSLVRRFGRDDDLLVLNYMTGNSDTRAPSNTMNPFSSGSASYLTNMLVSLMPEAEGDNAMWKERAVSLVSSLMPVLTWKRDNQDIPMSVTIIREHLNLNKIIQLSRDEAIPHHLRHSLVGYLDTLPGYIADAFDDEGREKPAGPDHPPMDTTTCRQQHGYLSMQFTRSLQSLGDDYGYIFDTQAADVDMVDVVLNRRIVVVLIPALEKSGDEIANLGKIVAATIKGMMGSTLGATVEGDSAKVIENKPTHSATPFVTIFDEVGYYTAQGMAVMAAQARSLGFCLVFSGQDLPAMKKRVREEANSITANCNIKIFGKLEDPTETKDFFEKTVGSAYVTEVQGFQLSGGASTGSYYDTKSAGVQVRSKASYDDLRSYKEGQAIITFGDQVMEANFFYSNPGKAKAMRVTRFVALPPPDETLVKNASAITKLRDKMVHKSWTAERAEVAIETEEEIKSLADGYRQGKKASPVERGILAVTHIHALANPEAFEGSAAGAGTPAKPQTATTPPLAAAKPAAPSAQTPVTSPASGEPAKPAIFGGLPGAKPASPPKLAAESPKPADAGNPMAIFGSGKKDGNGQSGQPEMPQQPATAAPAPVSKGPISWKDLVDTAGNELQGDGQDNGDGTGSSDSSLPVATLPDEALGILQQAGKDAGSRIFSQTESTNATQ
ncbi:MAG: type IV secretion protein IcmO [Alphaproteobacteria bacterium]|nr:type IV secretion protein IcmO [Alphaproteobacteria bacterium]